MILKLTDLCKTYDQAHTPIEVLSGLNLTLEKGLKLAILGRSGSGKSTLLSLIAGLDSPTRGEISIAGQDIGPMSENELTRFRARTLGIIFQQFHLMENLTALENVSLPLEIARNPDAMIRAREVLAQVGLSDRLEHFPSELSGGEKQRVAIARALVVKPALLLADEPSGNLDTHTGDQVMNLLFELVERHQMTLILVTHSDELAARCERQLTLREGALFESENSPS